LFIIKGRQRNKNNEKLIIMNKLGFCPYLS
jgi:hypothetical protein